MKQPEFALPPNPADQLSYEAAFAELEAIVAALENDSDTLENALALYERGQALARRCAALLDQAELKVRQLANGALSDFEVDG